MKEKDFKVIDNHFHIYDFDNIRKNYDKNGYVKGIISFLDHARGKIGETKTIRDLKTQDMVDLIDEWGLEKAILHPLSTKSFYGFDQMSNESVFKFAEKHPDKFAICVELDPRDPTSISKLEEHTKNHDVKSINMNPNFFRGFFYNDKELYPYYEKAQELGLPIMMHTGPTIAMFRAKYNNPLAVDDVAVDFPGLNLVIEHMGHPWADIANSIAMKQNNVFIGLSGTFNYLVKSSPIYAGIELQRMLKTVGPKKMIFGTDTPSVGGGKEAIEFIKNYKNTIINKMTGAYKLEDNEKRMILRDNARGLFKL